MHLRKSLVSFIIACIGGTLFIQLYRERNLFEMKYTHLLLVLGNLSLYLLPLIVPLILSVSSKRYRLMKGIICGVSITLSLLNLYFWYVEEKYYVFITMLMVLYAIGTIVESIMYFGKWIEKTRRRKAMRRTPVVRRRFGGEIKTPPIVVSSEIQHLRAKTDFVINGVVYIRKGETVEKLKPIGSYYSVRNATGSEYIVPRANFF